MSCVTKPICARSCVEVDLVAGHAVVEDAPGLRAVESDQQLDERRLAGAGRSDERDRLAALRRANEMSLTAGDVADWC